MNWKVFGLIIGVIIGLCVCTGFITNYENNRKEREIYGKLLDLSLSSLDNADKIINKYIGKTEKEQK